MFLLIRSSYFVSLTFSVQCLTVLPTFTHSPPWALSLVHLELYYFDQHILNQYIWPKVENDSLQHDSYTCDLFPNTKPFPTKRKKYFVGCVRDCWVFKDEICPEKCRPINHQDWLYC